MEHQITQACRLVPAAGIKALFPAALPDFVLIDDRADAAGAALDQFFLFQQFDGFGNRRRVRLEYFGQGGKRRQFAVIEFPGQNLRLKRLMDFFVLGDDHESYTLNYLVLLYNITYTPKEINSPKAEKRKTIYRAGSRLKNSKLSGSCNSSSKRFGGDCIPQI